MVLRVKWWEGVIWAGLLLLACGLYYAGLTVPAALVLLFLIDVLLYRVFIVACVRKLTESEQLVLFRRGQSIGVRHPKFVFVIPWMDSAVLVDLRERHVAVSGARCITKDGLTIHADLSFFWKVDDARLAAEKVANLDDAVRQLTTTTLQAAYGNMDLSDILDDRRNVDAPAVTDVNEAAASWGVRITRLNSEPRLPPDLEEAFAKQLETYRAKTWETRGKVEAVKQLNAAAQEIRNPRFVMNLVGLETLSKIGEAQSTKYLLPMEWAELVRPLTESLKKVSETTEPAPEPAGEAEAGEDRAAADEVPPEGPAPAGGTAREPEKGEQPADATPENAQVKGGSATEAGEERAAAEEAAPGGPGRAEQAAGETENGEPPADAIEEKDAGNDASGSTARDNRAAANGYAPGSRSTNPAPEGDGSPGQSPNAAPTLG